MPWKLELARTARKQLANLPTDDRGAVLDALKRLAADPSSVDLRKLTGREGEWRVRVRGWRIILALHNATGVISVLRVAPRRDAYRD